MGWYWVQGKLSWSCEDVKLKSLCGSLYSHSVSLVSYKSVAMEFDNWNGIEDWFWDWRSTTVGEWGSNVLAELRDHQDV